MSTRVEAQVRPSLLVWARESVGLTREAAAKKLEVDTDRIRAWESGETRPSVSQLRRVARAYKRPLAAFFLLEPPLPAAAVADFRSVRADAMSSELRIEIRRAAYRRQLAREVVERLGAQVRALPAAPTGQAPEDLGTWIRSHLNVALEQQSGWKDERAALNRWIDAVERRDVLVAQTGQVELSEMRGFSVAGDAFPLIVLNGKDAPRGRIFTLLHELVHVWLRAPGVCDTVEFREGRQTSNEIERICNAAAAAVLMPVEAIDARLGDRVLARSYSDEEIDRLANWFWVSREALLLRLVSLKRATWSFYHQKAEEYRSAHQPRRDQKGGPSYFTIKLRDNGYRFTSSVLEAFRSKRLSPGEACEYLDVRVSHLARLEHALDIRRAANEP